MIDRSLLLGALLTTATFSIATSVPPMSHHDNTCISGDSPDPLRVHVPPGVSGQQSFTFPGFPPAGSDADELAFIVQKAVILLPPGCVAQLGLTANADSGPGTARNLWVSGW